MESGGTYVARHEPTRRAGIDARKVQLRHGRGASLRGAEVARSVGPATSPPGAEQHDRRLGDAAMLRFPGVEVARSDAVVPVGLDLAAHVYHAGKPHELGDRDLLRRVPPAGEVDRCVEVRAAVL